MTMPLIVGLVVGALTLIALALYANRPRPAAAQPATAHTGTEGYVPMVFGDSSSDASTAADCGSDPGAGCGDGGGGGGD